MKKHGKIAFTPEEKVFLEQNLLGKFEKHPVFEGVEIKQLNLKKVPSGIQKKNKDISGNVTAFVAIKIKKEIPLHQHTLDGEIYFGGSNGIIKLLDDSKKDIGKFDLNKKVYTITRIGEWHGVKSNNKKGSTFFGVKFIIEKN